MALTRRDVLKWALEASALSAAGTPFRAFGAEAGGDRTADIPYGAAVYLPDLQTDARLGAAISRHCTRVTPVTELKWSSLRPTSGTFDFAPGDAIVGFADGHGMDVHGHTLVWHASLPDWVESITDAGEAERLMREHVATVMARYKKSVRSWDVVNEPIPDAPDGVTDRRDGYWSERLGPRHVRLAFEVAHAVDPAAMLVLNEYDVEFAVERSPAKRAAFRNLVEELLDQGAPVHAIGLQGHLRGGWPIAIDELADFVVDMRRLGLQILVTELDVQDQDLVSPADERDAVIAGQVFDFLSAVSAAGPPHSITTWGISDQYSWVRWAFPRSDGTRNRPLPLDWDFQRKPFMDVIDHFRTLRI